MKLEHNFESKIKSNRLPLCGGQDISVGIRDKILSVMERNRKRSITAMDLSAEGGSDGQHYYHHSSSVSKEQ